MLKLLLERAVKAAVTRERPGTSIGSDIEVRGDVSISGESFVSGHAVLVVALAMLVAPYLRGRWRYLPWVAVALVLVTRVYVGAHNPLDVICGAALGFAIGGASPKRPPRDRGGRRLPGYGAIPCDPGGPGRYGASSIRAADLAGPGSGPLSQAATAG